MVVFKGTSPFNLVEWMTDFTMSKIKPHGEYLPGMVHEVHTANLPAPPPPNRRFLFFFYPFALLTVACEKGFYEQFQWPVYLRAITDEVGDREDNEDNRHHASKTPRPSPLKYVASLVHKRQRPLVLV